MYWVVLSVILLAESWAVFLLGWIPFYSWLRLFFFAYLVLPQTQGARLFYQDYVDPFLEHHEREIEEFIGRAHERAKLLGLQYFYQVVDLIREKVLGRPAPRPATPPSSGPAAYAQALLSRFNIPAPAASGGAAAGAAGGGAQSDWFSTISSAVASVTSSGKNHEARAEELSASGTLFPREMSAMSRTEKAEFISNQRDLLDVLHAALVKEQGSLGEEGDDDLAYGGAPLKKKRSENSFDHIDHEDASGGGGWASGWFGGDEGGRAGRRR